jgi:hypothetical protein
MIMKKQLLVVLLVLGSALLSGKLYAQDTYSLSGTIVPPVPEGTELKLISSTGEKITVAGGADTFAFATQLSTGDYYWVKVASNPTENGQTFRACYVENATDTGTIADANVTNISVNCQNGYLDYDRCLSNPALTGLDKCETGAYLQFPTASLSCIADSCICQAGEQAPSLVDGSTNGYWFDLSQDNLNGDYKIQKCNLWVTFCGENQYVDPANNRCENCLAGSSRPAGDDPKGPGTACYPDPVTACNENEFVNDGSCSACPVGTTNPAGDNPMGENTSCKQVIACTGFESPMNKSPVRVKKNRALPLKAGLFGSDTFARTDADLVAPPVVQVVLDGAGEGEGDYAEDVLPAGKGSEGNQFVFTDEGVWQFNLKTSRFTAPGTYTITMESGDPEAYTLDSQCEAKFVIQ